jgi:hypothetical protein
MPPREYFFRGTNDEVTNTPAPATAHLDHPVGWQIRKAAEMGGCEIAAVYAGLRGLDFCRPLGMHTAEMGIGGIGMDKGDF